MLEKITLQCLHTRRGTGDSQIHSCIEWPAYVGGQVPNGIAVCRTNRVGTCILGSTWWLVHIRSRWPITVSELPTRKAAIFAAKRLGELYPQVDWTATEDDIFAALSAERNVYVTMGKIIREWEARQ